MAKMDRSTTTLRLLCWSGYNALVSEYKDQLRDEYGLEVLPYPELNADRIYRRFSAAPEAYDLVIVDWEYRHLYVNHVLELSSQDIHESEYLKPFSDLSLYEVQDRLSFVPVRFGTNGFLTASHAMRSPQRHQLDLASTIQSWKEGTQSPHLGVWNWWLPNMLLLSRAVGHEPPHELSTQELRELSRGILRDFMNAVRSSSPGTPVVFDSLEEVIKYNLASPQTGAVEWVLGPSEMVVAPVAEECSRTGRELLVDWDIPRGAGLLWIETVAVSRALGAPEAASRKAAAKRFLTFLQSESIQSGLICAGRPPRWRSRGSAHDAPRSGGHWSYVLNNVTGFDRVDSRLRAYFNEPTVAQGAKHFGEWLARLLADGQIVLRQLPPNHTEWQRAWAAALSAASL